jgi:hypothetical protein
MSRPYQGCAGSLNETYCGPGVRKSDGNRITITKQTQQAAVEAVQQRAAERAAELAAIIKELQVGGAESLTALRRDRIRSAFQQRAGRANGQRFRCMILERV